MMHNKTLQRQVMFRTGTATCWFVQIIYLILHQSLIFHFIVQSDQSDILRYIHSSGANHLRFCHQKQTYSHCT